MDTLTANTSLIEKRENVCNFRTFFETERVHSYFLICVCIKILKVLDPTCGSGAFLFAALNLLEPLYYSCLSRMEDFLTNGQMLPLNAKKLFTETIEKMNVHPNKQYFIYKSIILNNLYGVDIMNEAVETAKLRLFLKLVSTAQPNYNANNIGIEPLPDVDFNIKSGNTLVGFANEKELLNALDETVEGHLQKDQVVSSLHMVSLKKNWII